MVLAEVFDKMTSLLNARESEEDVVAWSFDGAKVCRRGWKILHGLGHLAK